MNKLLCVPLALSWLAVPVFAGSIDFTFNDLIFPNPPRDTTSFTAAYGVNDSGTVVGYYNTLNHGTTKFGFNGSTVPSVSLSTLTLTNGSPSCSPTDTFPSGINSSGGIAGGVAGCGASNGSFVTTNNGASFKDFNPPGTLVPSGYTLKGGQATALNSSEVVGYFVGQKAFSFAIQGYTTSDESNFSAVIDPNTGATGVTIPAGVDGNGDIVGLYVNANNATVGFLLNNGTFYDVVDPLGVNFTDATGIDSAGDIIGFYKDGNGLSRGFILSGYTLGGGLINGGTFTALDDPNAGNNGSNSEGTQILGIDPKGNEIVGLYKNSNGTNGFYAMAPTPEPGSVLLMLTGLGALAGWGWRRRKRAPVGKRFTLSL